MKKYTTKPLSNLDLKLLDVKFISINDNQIYLTQALHSVRKAKLIELPSLSISKNNSPINDSTQADDSIIHYDFKNKSTIQSITQFDQSILSNKFRSSQFSCLQQPQNHKISQHKSLFSKNFVQSNKDNQIQKLKEEIRSKNINKKQSQTKSLQSLYAQNSQASAQKNQLQKYRRKIQFIKKQNLLIHKQISSLYRNKINQNKEPLKKIKKIQPFRMEYSQTQADNNVFGTAKLQQTKQNKDIINMKRTWQIQKLMYGSIIDSNQSPQRDIVLPKKLASSPIIRQKINFYQNLSQKSPYKQQLQNIHKKIISNNLHKNFEQYLAGANKRVPQFIKKLRN